MSGGLLIAGLVVPVPGFDVIGPHEQAWATLSPGDGCPRTVTPDKVIVHRTLGDDPDHVLQGAGPSGDAGGARRTAEFWQQDPKHSGAAIVIGLDGEIACLCDLVRFESYNATSCNPWAIGIELHELPGGVLYQRQLDALVATVRVICEHTGIQMQCPSGYGGQPLRRFAADGGRGRGLVGIFGHRDQSDDRGRWDPGDAAMQALVDAGAHEFNFDRRADIAWWMTVQQDLAARKLYSGAIDGIPGRQTTDALRLDGYRGGVYALGKG